MTKHFFSHLIETESLVIELNKLDLTDQEKAHLLSIIDSSLHHVILDAVLSELSEDDKKQFLHLVSEEKHDDLWDFLNKRVDNIEGKIKDTAEALKKELHEDIKEAKSK